MEDKIIDYTADKGNVEVVDFDDASSTVKVSVITSLVQIGQGLMPGGKKGQVYTKKSDADFDADWEDNLAIGVEGIKGSAESGYSQGFYEITPGKIGLGKVDNTSDKDKPISDAQVAVNAQVESAISDINTKSERIASSLNSHTSNTSNPHDVTKEQIGLGSVDNTSDEDKPISKAQAVVNSTIEEEVRSVISTVTSHISDKQNPHEVTKAQIGLSNVNNTADIDKPISTAQAAAIQALQTNVNTQVNDIKAVIPSQASADNKLIDTAALNSRIKGAFKDLASFSIPTSAWAASSEIIAPFVYVASVSVTLSDTITESSPVMISFDDVVASAGVVAQSVQGTSTLNIVFYSNMLPSVVITGKVGGIA